MGIIFILLLNIDGVLLKVRIPNFTFFQETTKKLIKIYSILKKNHKYIQIIKHETL